MKNINVALLGCGTVGTGVYQLLDMHRKKFRHLLPGKDILVKGILVADLHKERPGIPKELLTNQAEELLTDPDIQVVIEVMGGVGAARDYILKALRNGKDVVTANKDLMATAGEEILTVANEMNRMVLFEASVAGAIPVISTVKNDLSSNQITKVMGIINGTTNFILTKMFKEGRSLGDVLQEAQALGYAEADPTSDIMGLDAARKIAILASTAFNRRVVLDDVYVEGITGIQVEDIAYARQLGSTIKLLGIASMTEEAIEVRVHPTLLSMNHPLAKVDDVYNAIYLEGNAFGDLTLVGKGAGGLPTASAVVADLLSILKNNESRGPVENCTCYLDTPIRKIQETSTHIYIRMVVADRTGVLAQIAEAFARNNVSIDSVIQRKLENGRAELVILTDKVLNEDMERAKDEISSLEVVMEIKSVLRSEKED